MSRWKREERGCQSGEVGGCHCIFIKLHHEDLGGVKAANTIWGIAISRHMQIVISSSLDGR